MTAMKQPSAAANQRRRRGREITPFTIDALRRLNLLAVCGLTLFSVGISRSSAHADIWNYAVVDRWDDVGRETSLALDSQDLPHITYTEADINYPGKFYLKYAYSDGTTWHTEELSRYDDHTGIAGYRSSLALDGAGRPCIAFHEGYWEQVAGTVRAQSILRYAHWDGSAWQNFIIDETGGLPALVLDGFDRPHVSYTKRYYVVLDRLIVPQADLMYAYWDGQGWQTETVEKGGRLGEQHNSLALDRDGRPHIAYYDFGTASTRSGTARRGRSRWWTAREMPAWMRQ
jgi:hypothetical protein